MKLIKTTKGHYILIDDTKETNDKDFIVGTSRDTNASKLSIKNCESIELGYDLDKIRNLAKKDFHSELGEGPALNQSINSMLVKSYMNGSEFGFEKAIEILGDKKFNQYDVLDVVNHVLHKMVLFEGFDKQYLFPESVYYEVTTKCQSIQQKEWDVEVEMEPEYIRMGGVKGVKGSSTKLSNPAYGCKKTDENGCLILKKK